MNGRLGEVLRSALRVRDDSVGRSAAQRRRGAGLAYARRRSVGRARRPRQHRLPGRRLRPYGAREGIKPQHDEGGRALRPGCHQSPSPRGRSRYPGLILRLRSMIHRAPRRVRQSYPLYPAGDGEILAASATRQSDKVRVSTATAPRGLSGLGSSFPCSGIRIAGSISVVGGARR